MGERRVGIRAGLHWILGWSEVEWGEVGWGHVELGVGSRWGWGGVGVG